jgi:hypothetical protein
MDERARNKRKLREVEQEDDEDEDEDEDDEGDDQDSYVAMDGVEVEKPLEGLKKAPESNKKQKTEPEQDEQEDDAKEPDSGELKLSKKEQKKAAKKERKAEKKATENDQEPAPVKQAQIDNDERPSSKKQKSKKAAEPAPQPDEQGDKDEPMEDAAAPETNGVHASESDSEPHSPTFDTIPENNTAAEPASATTSVSSTIPPSEKPKHIKMPADTSALKARLAAKIEALRAARKADGADGKPIRTRQELIEARRQKQNQRKEHKKELRRLTKLEEERKREETLASNSPSIMSPTVEMDESGSFSFGRVAFGDGSQMSHDLSYVLNQNKKKGPSDAKTALLKVQNQKKRLQELDEEKRNDITEKDAWLNARRRVEGEKIRDDEAILKKTVKRKDAAKKKSEKQWKDRIKGIDYAQKERQKKREENLRKRREEKSMGGKGGKKKKGGAAAGKKKGGRPGFEGSFGVGGRKK